MRRATLYVRHYIMQHVSGITSCSVPNRARSRRWIGLASLDLKIVPGRAVMLAANAVSTQTVN
jgi:hypothetical protein